MQALLKRMILTGIGLTFVAGPLSAQGGLMLGGGLTLPEGDYKDAVKSGFHGMAALNFRAAGAPLGIRLDAAYHLNAFDLPGNPDAKANIIAASGDAVYHFPSALPRPYVLGGITWAELRCQGNDCAPSTTPSDVGFNVGGGVDLGGFFVEARYFSIGGKVDAKFLPITVGLRF